MHESGGGNAMARKAAIGPGGEIAAANAVNQHPDLHAAPMRPDQRVDKRAAGHIITQDVARKRDARCRGVDRRQHERVGFIAIAQGFDAIAANGRRPVMSPPPDRAAPDVFAQNLDAAINFLALNRRGAHFLSAPANAVDAEQGIESRSDDGRKPGKADPSRRRAHIRLRSSA